MYRKYGKRILDIGISLSGILLLSPVFLVTFLTIRIVNNTSPIFRQLRPGLNGRIFAVYKFRTMDESRDASGQLLSDRDRTTRLGHFLRNTSLDELPQLWNVLAGDMSIVGPRPLLVEYLPLYTPHEMRRHDARPGITGWAQVNGRNSISWQEKFELDIWYVDHLSFRTDLKIIFITFSKIFRRDQVNSSKDVPMEKFIGS